MPQETTPEYVNGIMPIVSLLFRVGPHNAVAYRPIRDMKVTAIVAQGSSFRVKLSDTTNSNTTGAALTDGVNLSTAVYINNRTSLVFENSSGTSRVGFLCAEEV